MDDGSGATHEFAYSLKMLSQQLAGPATIKEMERHPNPMPGLLSG